MVQVLIPFFGLGELRHIHRLRFWPIESVLHDKYLLSKEEADLIGSFITPMLRLNPERRARASEMTHHQWLDGISVQGEIDQIRATEEKERQAVNHRDVSSSTSSSVDTSGHHGLGHKRHASSEVQEPTAPSAKRLSGVVPNGEVDALKPVDEGAGMGMGMGTGTTTAPDTTIPPHTSSSSSQHYHHHHHHSQQYHSVIPAPPQLSDPLPPNSRDRSSMSHGPTMTTTTKSTTTTTTPHHHHHHVGETHTSAAAAATANENPVQSQRLVPIP